MTTPPPFYKLNLPGLAPDNPEWKRVGVREMRRTQPNWTAEQIATRMNEGPRGPITTKEVQAILDTL